MFFQPTLSYEVGIFFYRCQGSFFYVHLGSEGLKHWIAGPTVIDYRILIEVPFHKDV